MLVLSRHIGETLVLSWAGQQIRVTLVRRHNAQIIVGIDAPPDVRIDRLEVHEQRAKDPRDRMDAWKEPA